MMRWIDAMTVDTDIDNQFNDALIKLMGMLFLAM